MRGYHVDVDFRFTVPAYSEKEAHDVILDGFRNGKYIPSEDEINVSEDRRGW